MQSVVPLVKTALIPGSIGFLLLGVLFAVLLLYRSGRAVRWARAWLTLLGVVYGVLSLPWVSHTLSLGLQGSYGSVTDQGEARGARTVVVIGNGAVSYSADGRMLHQLGRRSAFTVLEAARVYRLLGAEWIVTSGGIPDPSSQARPESEVMRDALTTLGVPADRVLLESDSRTTAEQLAGVSRLLQQRQIHGTVVLVTTAAHVRRVMSAARKEGLDAVPSVADDLQYSPGTTGWRRWFPATDALRGSESAMYEYLALAYYRLTGRAG